MIGIRLDELASAFGGSDGRGPLQGLRVLDAGTMIAGPLAATHLADFGADVVKIEQPQVADADIVIENYRPGTFERWGLGYAELARLNPLRASRRLRYTPDAVQAMIALCT